MKSSIKFNIITTLCGLALSTLVLWGCSKGSNNSFEVYGPVDGLTATFTVTPIPGTDARYVITNTTQGDYVATKWDLGKDTSGGTMGKAIDTAYFPLPGTYNITMYAVDKRGKLYKAAKPVTVTTTLTDPAFLNLIKGGKMNAGDEQYWKTFNAKTNKITWTLANNFYTATISPKPATSQVIGGIYQAVQMVANKKYRFTMTASYDKPQDAWLETYFGGNEPAELSDYTEGGNKLGFITWGNWITYNGTKTVDVTLGITGTVYVVIKTGCNSPNGHLGNTTGIGVTNIDFRRIQE